MADATYDVVVVGGGNKALVTAMYLQRYGGMKVGVFERRHEIGGGWASEEAPAPGFIANTHATDILDVYMKVVEEDFPEIYERGFGWIPYKVAYGTIFKEDHSCLAVHSPYHDPSQEKTAASMAQFNPRDADTWLALWELWEEYLHDASARWMHNPAGSLYQPDILEETAGRLFADPRAQKLGIDPSWLVKSPLEVMRDLFEDEGIIAGILRVGHSWCGNPSFLSGAGLFQFVAMLYMTHAGCFRGGTHTPAHCTYKVFTEDGGKCFTEREVEKIIIEHGKAKGIKLADGTEIEAKKAVISTLDPYSLVFKLTGKEHWHARTVRRVANLSRWRITITWYSWAMHELPHYRAASFNPDIDMVGWLGLGTKDPLALERNHAWRSLGKMDPAVNLIVWAHTIIDPTQAPAGKHVCGTEDFVLSADQLTEREWREYKKKHTAEVMEEWKEYAPNMTWDNIIGYTPQTPYECARMANMAPQGNWAVIDHIPSQVGKLRPVPELAGHKTPIANLYATCAGWHPAGGAFAAQGYNCYKVMAEDLGLKKPWEKKDRKF